MKLLGGLEVFDVEGNRDQRAQRRLAVLRRDEREGLFVVVLRRRRIVSVARELP